ncbi:hypothetical protein BTB_15p00120 (plasmid) [Bacillus thuringiensis Bt407]|uniref:Uncharacterized protein n=2 Tax=Bacillus thuringiensis TaxID=1428 RepID=A0AAP4QCV4_BACTU|nr:hypothetical protein BTB_15p00120 [Bacillus thuringiensis Bt407]AGG04393.1 hypothetical protein H175_15p13 [Bacillus thuringiensis serovar thuringiensis str. IS5056]ERH96629.1 hypothetical protein BTCBT_007239 [Bacillus thuringiensis T01-328]MBG9624130.1 hypothetical protein [Bacillus thuringiensis]OTW42173.1 hypothetical protein BK698_07140 [Bacillus thuringiensis serovar thuringiensis]
MSNAFKPTYMTSNDYVRSKEDITALERELGMTPGQLYKTRWTDIKALYMAGKLHENDMNVLFTRKKVYDPSLYDCVLNSECQIVHKSELYDNQMRERARRIRNLL